MCAASTKRSCTRATAQRLPYAKRTFANSQCFSSARTRQQARFAPNHDFIGPTIKQALYPGTASSTEPYSEPCIGARLESCRKWPQTTRPGFSPCSPSSLPSEVAIRILLRGVDQSRIHRILSAVLSIAHEAFLLVCPDFGKPTLPQLAQVLEFPLQAIGEVALNELHSLFDGHIPADRQQEMQVIRHDHEIVQQESPRRHLRS